MLKTNLSTRPFYNERLVNLVLLLAAVAGLLLAAFNAERIYTLSGEKATRTAEQRQAEAEAAQLLDAADRNQKSIDRNALRVHGYETAEANALIDERTFSWTVFFDLVEKTLPLDARLIAVSPTVEKGVFRIDMILNVKRPDDLKAFLTSLYDTGSFHDVMPVDEQRMEDGTHNATLSGAYLAPVTPAIKAAGRGGRSAVAMSLAKRVYAERRAVVLTLGVFLLANVAVLGGVVWPLQNTVNGAAEARSKALYGLETARKLESEAKGQAASIDRARTELKKFYGDILPKSSLDAIHVTNFWLGKVAEDCRLTFRTGSYESKEVRGSRLMQMTGQVSLIGDYNDVRKFLYEVETAQEFVIVKEVALSQASSNQGTAPLELQLVVVTYYLPPGALPVVSR